MESFVQSQSLLAEPYLRSLGNLLSKSSADFISIQIPLSPNHTPGIGKRKRSREHFLSFGSAIDLFGCLFEIQWRRKQPLGLHGFGSSHKTLGKIIQKVVSWGVCHAMGTPIAALVDHATLFGRPSGCVVGCLERTGTYDSYGRSYGCREYRV